MYVGAAPSLAHKFKTASCIHVGALKNPFLGEVRRLDAERPREGLHGQAVEELGGVDVGVDREIERFPSSSSVNCILMLQCTLPHCAPTAYPASLPFPSLIHSNPVLSLIDSELKE